MHTTHTGRNQSRGGSHVSHERNAKDKHLEIDHLKRSLRHERQKRALFVSDFSSDGEGDGSYRRRSRTPPNESFSYEEDFHNEHRNRNSSSKGLKNDAISKVLNQISKSPFMHKIKGGRLPQQFA